MSVQPWRVQNPNWPLFSCQANFATGANASIPNLWYDLTQRDTEYDFAAGKQFELNTVQAGTGTFKLRDADEYLNPANAGSPYNTGGNTLKPYRWIRSWAAWPLAGNVLNATNDQWPGLYGAGTLADTASFEGGTVGTWAPAAGCTAINDGTRAHDGSLSMLVTWSTTAGGVGVADVAAVTVPVKTGTAYAASCWVWIGSGPAVTLTCQGVSATSTATTGAWQRVVLTWTALDATDTTLHVSAAGSTTAGQQVWIDSVQVEAASSVSAWTSIGPTIHPVHTAFIEAYPLRWEEAGYEGWTDATSVDALAPLSRIALRDVVTQDALQDVPVLLWPLWDASGASVAVNIGDHAGASMVLVPVGAPAQVTTQLGASGSPGLDGFSSASFAPATTSDTYVLATDWNGQSGFQVGGTVSGWTVELWFLASGVAGVARIARPWCSGLEELAIELTATGSVQYRHVNASAATDATITTLGGYADGAWHHVAVTSSVTAGTVTDTLTVDGLAVGSAARSGALTPALYGLMLGADWRGAGSLFSGQVARAAIYAGALPQARIVSHWLAGWTGFAGDTTGTRIGRILAWAGWSGPSSMPAGLSRHGPLIGLDKTAAVDACQTAAATEQGSFLVSPLGVLTLIPRSAYYAQTTPVVTLGEDWAAGEWPYMDAQASTDPTYVYNTIQITGSGGTQQTVTDDPSAQDYGSRSYTATTSHANDPDAASLASYLLLEYVDARMRVAEVTLQPSTYPALFPIVLGTGFGARVTWKRRTSAGVTIVLDGFIENVHHTIKPADTADAWTTKWTISPVDTFQAGLVGVTGYDTVGTTFLTAY